MALTKRAPLSDSNIIIGKLWRTGPSNGQVGGGAGKGGD